MSLQVWLPLTKDLRQQGLNSATIEEATSAVFDNGGKLGKCLSGGKIKIPANQVASIFNNTSMSIAFWYNNNTLETTGNHAICGFSGNTEGDTDAVRIWDFFNYANPNTFHWSMGTLGGGSLSNIFPANTWVHVCVTWNAPTLKIYMDGVLKYTGSGSSNYTFNKSYYISFGRTPQKLNDFRIYDHCLSPMEVKELAKGLVLHFPLNRGGWGQENLIKGSNTNIALNGSDYSSKTTRTYDTATGVGRIEVISAGSWNAWRFGSSDLSVSPATLSSGATTYTFSVDIRVTNYSSGDILATFDFRTNNSVHSGINCILTSKEKNGSWHRVYGSFTTGGQSDNQCLFCITSNATTGNVGLVIEYKNFKLEEGDKPTPWCPNSADTLATTMGLNGTTEYDCSGFCNNGTRTGTFSWTSDTPKYKVSTVFDASHPDYIKIPYANYATQGAQAMTWSIWAYDDDWSTYSGRIYSCTEGGGVNIEDSGSTTINWAVNMYTAADQSTYAYQGYCTIAKSSLSAGWHMFTWVYTTTGTKVYVDGVLASTYNITSYGLHFANTALYLGAEAQGETTSTGCYLTGKLSDFRIYATALSATDVAELYKSRNF